MKLCLGASHTKLQSAMVLWDLAESLFLCMETDSAVRMYF